MIRQISVGNLCGELGEMLIHFQYSSDSLRRYNKVFDEFTEYAGEREYSQQLGAAIRTLAEYYNFGVIFRRQDFRGEIIWPEPFRECTEKFLLSKVEYGVCYGYVKHCRTILKDLILFFDAIGIHAPEEVSYTHLERFINSLVGWSASTVRSRISLVRMYFRFLFLNGDIKEPIAEKLPGGLTPRGRTKLPTVWQEDEIDKLLGSIDLTNPNGKKFSHRSSRWNCLLSGMSALIRYCPTVTRLSSCSGLWTSRKESGQSICRYRLSQKM